MADNAVGAGFGTEVGAAQAAARGAGKGMGTVTAPQPMPAGAGSGGGAGAAAPTAAQSDAFAMLRNLLRSYGIEELYDWAREQFLDGRSMAEIELGLEQQPVVQQKFKAVFDRRAAGLPPISILDVVEYQRKASELEHLYGVPRGFLDVNRLLVADVSINEANTRLAMAADAVTGNPEVLRQLRELYGVDEGQAIAFFADPDSALPKITQQFTATRLATQAKAQQFGQLTRDEAERLAREGVSEDQARAGFGALATSEQVTGQIAGDRGPAMTRERQLDAVAGNAGAVQELERRRRERTAVFDEGGRFAGGLAN